jgi:hypothetical protein
MEAFGTYNHKSTPESRNAARDRANFLGNAWMILTTNQPFLIVLVVLAFVAAGVVENVYNP